MISDIKKEESIDADYLAPAKYDQYYGAYATLPDWFLAELASREKVLELACGTGRIAIPLAEHGLEFKEIKTPLGRIIGISFAFVPRRRPAKFCK